MPIRPFIRQASYRQRLLPGLTLLWALALTLGLIQPAQAQSTTPGYVFAWGQNQYGQSNVPAGLSGVTAIAAGYYHNLALKSDGTITAWGDNAKGQLNIPVGLSGVTAIAAGFYHNLALKSDGTVVAWGDNSSRQLNIPAGLSGVTAIAAGAYHSLALKSNGTVIGWGDNSGGEIVIPAGLSGVTAIAAGYFHSLAVKNDGTVVAWGYNNDGQVTVPAGLSGVTAIAAGGYQSLAVKRDGTVVGWGDNSYGQVTIPAGLSGVTAVATGYNHSLARKSDGTVVAWGDNSYGQLNIPTQLHSVIAIGAGAYHSLALNTTNDFTPPTAKPGQSPPAIATGWTDSDVTVSWNWSDNTGGSGLDLTHCTNRSTSSGEGEQTLTATCQDKAGNVGSASYTVKVDKTGPVAHPTLSPAANAAGWNNTNVTVNWNWTDPSSGSGSGSGVAPGNCETSSTSNIGVGAQTLTAYCSDQVGNLTSASYTVQVDRAAPQIRSTVSPAANGFGWNNSAVTVSFVCQEQGALSGIATNTIGGNQTFSSEGTNFTAINTGTCTDYADNVATAVTVGPIKIDLTKPTISAAATTQPNANGWYNSAVTVHFTCADNLAGAFNCPADQTLSSEGTALSSTAQTVLDRALNSSNASNIVTVKIDKTAPSVLLIGVTNGATYNLGSVPTTACSTTDALSGVATQATLSVTGGNPDGSGNFTATCNGATDLASNSAAPVSVSYTVNAPLLPEIAVTGNGQPLTSGSTTPSSSNGTNLGSTLPGSAVTQTFTIVNSGTGVLNLSGAPRVGLSGANAADFSVVTLPAAMVATGSSTTFQIRFTPSAAGVRTATVTIANNDSDENPYTFVIQGAGLQSLQPTSQLTQLPGYTQSCTAASTPYVKRCTLSFTLKNTSSGPLQIRYEQLTKLSTHVYVLNGTPNPGQVGTVVSDGRSLAVNATFPPTFQLGLTSNTAYSLFFKVYGYPGATVAAGADEAQAVELGEFKVTLNPDETLTTTTLFLPLINH